MAYTIEFTNGLLTLRFFGTISSDDLRFALADVEAIEAHHDTAPHRITDLSAGDTGEFNIMVIESLAARRRNAVLKNRVKSAIFAPSDLQFGYSRMFQSLSDNPSIAVAVFRSRSEADAWLADGDRPPNWAAIQGRPPLSP